MRHTVITVVVAVTMLLSGAVKPASAATEVVVVDGASGGRRFDGVGAISAGGSSRLLIDYPEPERGQILDYLFKPNYGAALDILKVEIGADTDTTSGAEASHMRRRGEVDCHRGYEWWLMREAKARHPGIKLYALAWGAPGWFSGGFWSQDNIGYVLAWLDCAGQHGLAIDYLGGGNERGWDRDFYIRLAAALDQNGYTGIQLVATDNHHPPQYWGAASEMVGDPQFRDAVDILGEHDVCGWRTTYTRCHVIQDALALNKPLWDSEQSSEDYAFWGKPLARAMNRHYIDARVTANLNWALTASSAGNLPAAGTGLLLADRPWSGYYEPGQAIWVDAHTTQFTDPGWRYLDSAAGYLNSGASHVAMRAPGSGDYTVVVETTDATQAQAVRFELRNGLSTAPVQLWATNLNTMGMMDDFRHVSTVQPVNGAFTVTLQPGHVYTLSTTTGQSKGTAGTAASRTEQMPLPYTENFDSLATGALAPYLSDVMGGFESRPCAGGRAGRCLRQMVTQEPILWHDHTLPPTTVLGDPRWWGDYEVAADVFLEQAGSAELIGRVSRQAHDVVGGYHLQFSSGSGWQLWSSDQYDGFHVLASGPQSIGVGRWHNVRLHMAGSRITVLLDNVQVGAVTDIRQRTGNVALRSSRWVNAQFDNVRITPIGMWPRLVPQDRMIATASSQYDKPYQGTSFPGRNAVDGRTETFWHSAFAPKLPLPQSLTVDLGGAYSVRGLTVQPRYDDTSNAMITSYHVYVSADGINFTRVTTGSWRVSWATKVATWPTRAGIRFVRLEAIAGVGSLASVAELNVMLG